MAEEKIVTMLGGVDTFTSDCMCNNTVETPTADWHYHGVDKLQGREKHHFVYCGLSKVSDYCDKPGNGLPFHILC